MPLCISECNKLNQTSLPLFIQLHFLILDQCLENVFSQVQVTEPMRKKRCVLELHIIKKLRSVKEITDNDTFILA